MGQFHFFLRDLLQRPWTDCQVSGIKGVPPSRKRFRDCMNGNEEFAACAKGKLETETCVCDKCVPSCPPGFTPHFEKGEACFKVVPGVFLNQSQSHHYCQQLHIRNVSLRASLASDKNALTHSMMQTLLNNDNVPSAYVGVNVTMAAGKVKSTRYVSDGSIVGELLGPRSWRDISIVTDGRQGLDGMLKRPLMTYSGKCLSAKDGKIFASKCNAKDRFWQKFMGMLHNVGAELCLARHGSGSSRFACSLY